LQFTCNFRKKSAEEEKKTEVRIHIEGDGEERNFPRVKEVIEKFGEHCRSVADYHDIVVNLIWRFTEIHIDKAIAFIMLHICVQEVGAMNIPYIIYVAVTLTKPKYTRKMSFCAAVWTSCVVILKMIYQMEFIKEDMLTVYCEDLYGINDTVHAPDWVGLHKTDGVFTYTRNYILLTILLAFRSIVELRQSLHRYERGEMTPVKGVLFNNITRQDLDRDLCSCFKYFVNFFFYRFGLEVCLMTTVITIGLRSDMLSVVYAIMLLIVLSLERKKLASIWSYIAISFAFLFTWQYILCVGIPKAFCQADFFLLLFICQQLGVFYIEANEQDYIGGTNESIVDGPSTRHGRKALFKIDSDDKAEEVNEPALPDFVGKMDSLLDRLKRIIFVHLYWVTLSVVFVAGTSRVTLFAFGYVVGCFMFLWVGNSLFLKPMRITLALWNKLIIYNASVIFVKISLQVVGCVYMSQMYKNFCWVIQLLGIACLKTGIKPENS
uniref:PIEZO domain-containing protein n=1 Tax=Anisakis simplex TaxID=6269 RepID=A0A0M3KAN0_ANISI